MPLLFLNPIYSFFKSISHVYKKAHVNVVATLLPLRMLSTLNSVYKKSTCPLRLKPSTIVTECASHPPQQEGIPLSLKFGSLVNDPRMLNTPAFYCGSLPSHFNALTRMYFLKVEDHVSHSFTLYTVPSKVILTQ